MAIFGVTDPSKRMFRAGEARATFNDINAILLNMNVQISRNLSPIPTLTEGIIWAAQPVQGQLQAQTIIASDKNITNLATTPCAMITGSVNFSAAECNAGNEAKASTKLTLKDGRLSSLSITANAQQGYIGSDLVIMFTQADLG